MAIDHGESVDLNAVSGLTEVPLTPPTVISSPCQLIVLTADVAEGDTQSRRVWLNTAPAAPAVHSTATALRRTVEARKLVYSNPVNRSNG